MLSQYIRKRASWKRLKRVPIVQARKKRHSSIYNDRSGDERRKTNHCRERERGTGSHYRFSLPKRLIFPTTLSSSLIVSLGSFSSLFPFLHLIHRPPRGYTRRCLRFIFSSASIGSERRSPARANRFNQRALLLRLADASSLHNICIDHFQFHPVLLFSPPVCPLFDSSSSSAHIEVLSQKRILLLLLWIPSV